VFTAPDCRKCEDGSIRRTSPDQIATVLTYPYFYGFFRLAGRKYEAHSAA
jgi:hypothetical protein